MRKIRTYYGENGGFLWTRNSNKSLKANLFTFEIYLNKKNGPNI
jgi:hypothetical protein